MEEKNAEIAQTLEISLNWNVGFSFFHLEQRDPGRYYNY
jgi:hypothetical protein